MSDSKRYLVLTPEQCAAGYVRTPPSRNARTVYFNGRVAYSKHPFQVVKKLSDGNYLVVDPSP